MLRNITLSADDQLIDLARKRATAAQSTLNVEFRKWLASYAGSQDDAAVARLHAVLQQLGPVDAGRTFSRDELNQR
ncbi:MAG: hypothetical protein PHH58_05525 [Rhodoferax sp.]|nr:hypothetical protein [Rhodoferax sp.]